MPGSLNKVFLIGNLTRDPEMRYIPSGQPVTSFSIAINRKYTDQSGGKKEETTFQRIVVWGKLAEICNQYLKKGSSVLVEGRLQGRTWSAQDGSKRTTVEVIAQNVQFLSKANSTRDYEPSVRENKSKAGEDMIIDDSFTPSGSVGQMHVSPNELAPDEDIPF